MRSEKDENRMESDRPVKNVGLSVLSYQQCIDKLGINHTHYVVRCNIAISYNVELMGNVIIKGRYSKILSKLLTYIISR